MAVVNTEPTRISTNGTIVSPKNLRLNLLVIHKDPRRGEQTTTVTQVDRGEPDPSIFEIPSGYKLIQPGALQQ